VVNGDISFNYRKLWTEDNWIRVEEELSNLATLYQYWYRTAGNAASTQT